jgi:CubicO group peptidase (beta-lactamase class C family)
VAGVALLVAWLGLGLLFSLGAVGFLLAGLGLAVVVQLGRRRSLAELWTRDRAGIGRSRAGKAGVIGVLLLTPAYLVVHYLPTWVGNSWIALLAALGLVVAYVAIRRLFVAVAVTAVLVAAAMWTQAPSLSTATTGDAGLLAQLDRVQDKGMLTGYENLSLATVDLDAAQPVRLAGFGADATRPMEIGSITKSLTGLVVADSVERGELSLDARVETYLPALHGSAAGTVTIRELVTHRSGYAEFGAATLRRAAWSAPTGRNWITADLDHLMREVRTGSLATRGTFAYSTLGAATAGQAAAAAAGMSYPDLMRTRLFEPLGMTHSAIQVGHPLVGGGRTASGHRVQPWVFGAYAPGGAAVSTAADLSRLATALLDGTAPGMNAMTPIAPTGQDNTRIGEFWHISRWPTGQTITWHNGQTAGYTAYLGLDRQHHRAVIVLSDVANAATTELGTELLSTPSSPTP